MQTNYENILLKLKSRPVLCGRCYEYVEEVFSTNCPHKPENREVYVRGMYICPDCGGMVLAGVEHPDVCKECLNRKELKLNYENTLFW